MRDILEELKKQRREQEEFLAQRLAQKLDVPYFNLTLNKPKPSALEFLPKEDAEKLKTIPLEYTGKNIILGIVDPFSEQTQNFIKDLKEKNLNVAWGIISLSSFKEGLDEYQIIKLKKMKITKTLEIDPIVVDRLSREITRKEMLQEFCKSIITENPFLLLDVIIAGAIKFEASDIHLEPLESFVVIRYRIDSLLYEVIRFPFSTYEVIRSRLKVISGMMLNVTDKPQDGRFSLIHGSENIDFRVSLLPSAYGESFVIRILFSKQILKSIEDLGLREDDYEVLLRNIHQPNGLILNTGPTGSGKTTTLYAILMKIKSPDLKIITIENPVEYKIEGITQVEIDERKNFTFAEALRSFLRHDPDIILVGEIRDEDTAQTAIQASLTGHLVLSTLHTNNSLGAIPRLISLKVNPKLIPSAMRLVIAQRLVRRICPFCIEEYNPPEELKEKVIKKTPMKLKKFLDLSEITLARGIGCDRCFNSGYRGRVGIFEILEITPNLEDLIYRQPSELEIYEAIKEDFVNLQQDGIYKALRKLTTIEEVERVTGLL